jgi:type IV secretion system protein VirB11
MIEKLERECGEVVLQALRNPEVIEINLNPDGVLWVEYLGRGKIPSGRMAAHTAESLLATCATMLDTVVTRENPIVEGEFPLDGSRLEAGIPPIASAPFFSIRKHSGKIFSLDEYVESGSLKPAGRDRIYEAVRNRENILVVGGTGSGKTTLGNAILDAMAKTTKNDRVVILQDTLELQVAVENRVLLRTSENVSMARLLRVAMRLQPDRVIVGEVRGGEAHSLLKAWNSGHPGGFCTIHADSETQGLHKLLDYVFEAPEMGARNDERIANGIARTVQLVVFIEKTGGKPARAIRGISQVIGFENSNFVLERVE